MKKKNGFSLIELMVSLSIFVILLTLSAPSYVNWLASMRVRNAAESINIGLLQARSEALRRNNLISFSVNNDTSWDISVVDTGDIINQKSAQEGTDTTRIQTFPTNANSITFNGLGSLVKNIDNSPSLESIDAISTTGIEAAKTVRVLIYGGSNVICDPSIKNEENYNYCKD